MMRMPKEIQLPVYKNDGKPLFIFNQTIKDSVQRVNEKINTGFYKHIENKCLCGNTHAHDDALIAEKDMWGISVESVVCSRCGLIRSRYIPDNKALEDFYSTDYKSIYYDSMKPDDEMFRSEQERGQGFLERIKSEKILENIETVFDNGCGMGGVLMPFLEAGKKVSGCDYGVDYIAFGKKKGLDLYDGALDGQRTRNNSSDLVIVSHVMEHFTEPVKSMQDIIDLVAPTKYLLVEVPGLYAMNPYKYYPVWHLQKPHVYQFFYKEFLIEFFTALGLEVVFGDERCTFLCKKPPGYQRKNVQTIFSEKLKEYPQRNLNYFLSSYRKYDMVKWKNPVRIAKSIIKLADFLKLRFVLNTILKDSKQWIS